MTQKPNDRYYTVAEVRQAKKFRADLRQFIKDSALDMVLRRETRAVIDGDGRFRHVPASGRTGMSRMWSDDTMAWMDDPDFGKCLAVDPIRQAAYDEAMSKFSGRKSLRHYMTPEQIRDVEAYDGPVILGDLVDRQTPKTPIKFSKPTYDFHRAPNEFSERMSRMIDHHMDNIRDMKFEADMEHYLQTGDPRGLDWTTDEPERDPWNVQEPVKHINMVGRPKSRMTYDLWKQWTADEDRP